MLREGQTRSERPRPVRIYDCIYGPAYTVILELESEETGEVGPFWEAWFAEPTTPAFTEKRNQLVAGIPARTDSNRWLSPAL